MSELPPTSEPPAADEPHEPRSRARNPWLWATVGVAVMAIALFVWALNERSNADDAKSDLQAEQQKPTTTTTQAQTETQPQTTTQETQPAETQTDSGDDNGRRIGLLAGATAAFAAARKQLNENQAKVDDLEKEVDKANADADKAQSDAEKAKAEAESTSDAQKKAQAEAEQAAAEKRQLGAKAQAAAACAKSMLEIVGDIPKASSPEEGLKAAGDEVTALVPKCKESVASAGG
jgi:hypothetical protein